MRTRFTQSQARTNGDRRLSTLMTYQGYWVLLVLFVAGTPVSKAQSTPPPDWPVELGAAFELYRAGDYLETQRICRHIAAATADPRLRRETSALSAMAAMHLPDRSDRVNGRARLAQLAEEDDSLLTRPECQLAYGIVQSSFSATASAIFHLNQAATRFAERAESERQGEALVALAQAWAQHGEWELSIPGVDLPQPESREQADQMRAEQIRAVLVRAQALIENQSFARRIELVLARHLIDGSGKSTEGLALLEKLTADEPYDITAAQAALVLAKYYENNKRWRDATELYTDVHDANLGEVSQEAKKLLQEINRPRLILDVQRQVNTGEVVEVNLSSRNVTAISFEVRRIDLESWLLERHGQYSEAALPMTGALLAMRDIQVEVPNRYDWWYTKTLSQPLSYAAPAGAVVISAQATTTTGTTIAVKRLVLAGDLRATLFTGSQHAMIWATTDVDVSDVRALFWMHGSFLPTKPEFEGNTAIFKLPGEAHVLRDKRWICLVQAGNQLALCQGQLPAMSSQESITAVALVGGPPEVEVGDQLHVFGQLLDINKARHPESKTVELRVPDALENIHASLTVKISGAGTFSARFPITPEMAGKNLHVAALLDGRALKTAYAPLNIRVLPLGLSDLQVECILPNWLVKAPETLFGEIHARYAWNTPATDGHGSARIQAVRMPSDEHGIKSVHSHATGDHLFLNEDGMSVFAHKISDFDLPEGPLALALLAEVVGLDGRRSQGYTEAIIAPKPIHIWFSDATAAPQVGQPFHITVNWFDPTALAAGRRPNLTIRRNGKHLHDSQLLPAISGLRSATWRPTLPGSYELVATIEQNDGETVTRSHSIEVAPLKNGAQPDGPLKIEARSVMHEGQPYVRVLLDGTRARPLLLLLEAGDPIAVREVLVHGGPTEWLLRVPTEPAVDMRLIVASSANNDLEIIGVTNVAPADEQVLSLEIDGDLEHVVPGDRLRISLTCRQSGQPTADATIMARLVDASYSGGMLWIPGDSRLDLTELPGGIHVFSSTVTTPTAGEIIPETRQLPTRLASALFDHRTTWIESRASTQQPTDIQIPLPKAPGFYRLILVAQTSDGGYAEKTLNFDTRQNIHASIDLPLHCEVGDRFTAAVTIENPSPVPATARVELNPGEGLFMERWEVPQSRTDSWKSTESRILSLTLAPNESTTLRACVEATIPTLSGATVMVETNRNRCNSSATYQVYCPISDTNLVPSFVLDRKLFTLVPDEIKPELSHEEPSDQSPQWLRIEIDEGQRLSVGQLILVQEEFTLPEPLHRVTWEQRLPGNCYTHAGDWEEFRRLGSRDDLQLGSLSHTAARLGPDQKHIHEYVIVPIRPGACRFPEPLVESEGKPVTVKLNTRQQYVIVAENKSPD